MRIRTLISSLAMWILAACAQPKKVEPPPQVRYLPAKQTGCIRKEPPKLTPPPKCFPLDPSTPESPCSEAEGREWVAAQQDHRVRLVDWANRWYWLCGPEAK